MITLTDMERDALTEAFNVALGAASATFADVVQTEVQMSVPRVDLLSRDELVSRLSELPDSAARRRVVAIAQDFASGQDIQTDAVLLMPQHACLEVVRRMLGEYATEVNDVTELEQDALAEIGNIIINSCMSTLADMLDMEFQGSLPKVNSAEVDALVDQLHPGQATLLAQISMTLKASNVSGMVLFLMNVPSLEMLIQHMRVYFGLPQPDLH
jgi:chemotaxis protein CheC